MARPEDRKKTKEPEMYEEKKKRKRGRHTVEESVDLFVQRLRGDIDDIVIPIAKFYGECRYDSFGNEDGDLVIFGLQRKGYEVRIVERERLLGSSFYIWISR